MEDKNKIIDALNTIKNVCKENECKKCPLKIHGCGKQCGISDITPINWEIIQPEEKIWRAFL